MVSAPPLPPRASRRRRRRASRRCRRARAPPCQASARAAAARQVAQVEALFARFKAAFAGGDAKRDECVALLAQLKVGMLSFSSLPPATPATPTAAQQQELALARDILEHGALLSIRLMDIPLFERHVAQLKVYYTDCAGVLPASQRQHPILGLNLLRLLAQNRIAEFHTEVRAPAPAASSRRTRGEQPRAASPLLAARHRPSSPS